MRSENHPLIERARKFSYGGCSAAKLQSVFGFIVHQREKKETEIIRVLPNWPCACFVIPICASALFVQQDSFCTTYLLTWPQKALKCYALFLLYCNKDQWNYCIKRGSRGGCCCLAMRKTMMMMTTMTTFNIITSAKHHAPYHSAYCSLRVLTVSVAVVISQYIIYFNNMCVSLCSFLVFLA